MISTITRHSILTLGFIAAVSGFALQAQAAAGGASPALSFYPAHGWSANTDGPACTIQSEYNNGFIVGFSGENKNLSALDVDFRQDIFNAGKTYDVGFRIPGSPPQRFSALAASPSMLKVNINSAGSLMTALRSASAFDLSVEDNDFRFFLTGFAAGAKNFEQCMKMPASGPTGEPITQVISAPEPAKAPPPPLLDAATAALPVDKNEAPDISVTETLPADPGMDQPFTPPEPRQRMSEKLAAQIAENPDMVKIENLPAPLQDKNKNISKETPDPVISTQRAEIKADFTDAEPSTGMDTADPEVGRKISELESKVHSLKKENSDLANDLQSTAQESRDEHISIASENWNLERSTMRYNEAERELKRIGQQLQQERAQCTVEKQDLEAQLFDPQVTSREQLAKLADLEQKLGDAKRKIDNQRIYYEERIRILEAGKTAQ